MHPALPSASTSWFAGASTASISGPLEYSTVSILELQSLLFASLTGCLVLVLRIIQELWQR